MMQVAIARPLMMCVTMGAIALVATAPGHAQTRDASRSEGSQSESGQTLRLPPGQTALELQVRGADRARVGESFTYEIHVRNVSDNLVLHDVKIAQETDEDGLTIESAQIERSGEEREGRRQGRNKGDSEQNGSNGQREDRNGNSSQESGRNADAQEQDRDSNGERDSNGDEGEDEDQQQQGEQEDGRHVWTIRTLEPGETRVISVTAAGDEEGEVSACLAVLSFTPTLCFKTQLVKPDLELVKRVPDEAGLCEPIEIEYSIANRGSAAARAFTIEDELSDGLQTMSGESSLRFEVDGLAPGDTRNFVAALRATRAGEFSSRAVARDGDDTLARSREESVNVHEADLAVAIEGPRAELVGQPLHYTIRVTNRGDAVAPDVELALRHAASAQVVEAGEPRASDQAVERQSSSGEPTPAGRRDRDRDEESGDQESGDQDAENRAADRDRDRQSSDQGEGDRPTRDEAIGRQSDQEGQDDGEDRDNGDENGQGRNRDRDDRDAEDDEQEMATHRWQLGDIEPGETQEVEVILRSREGGMVRNQAVTHFYCGLDEDQDRSRISTVAMLPTRVIALPGLLVTVVDDMDPVEIGEEVTYSIVVENQGDAEDRDIQVTAEAPEGTEIVSTEGETDGKTSGRDITFEPIDRLAPGEKAAWKVRLKGGDDEQVVFKVTLESESLSTPAQSEEPTRFYRRNR